MLNNYGKVAVRTMMRNKTNSIINLAGLSVGAASFILIFSYVSNEMTFDTFHSNAADIYRIYTKSLSPGNTTETLLASSPDPLPRALQTDYPEMFKVARLFSHDSWVTSGDRSFKELVYYGDPSFFDVFRFPFLKGDRRHALGNPGSIIVTKRFAEKMFGGTDPMGRTLTISNAEYMVDGVLEDFPVNSSINFDVLLPAVVRKGVDPGFEEKWYSWGTYTFVALSDRMTAQELRDQLPKIVQNHMPDFLKKGTTLVLEPLTDTHLNSAVQYNMVPPVSRRFLLVLMIIAGAILLISCVNFANIAVAQYADRAKEIGVRKVLGARRMQVATQLLGESVLMSFLSLVIGIALAELSLNEFRSLTGKQIDLYPLFTLGGCLKLLGFGILTGLVAGSYPAIVLSACRRSHGVADSFSVRKSGFVRNLLVVGQFIIAAVLITSMIVVSRQIAFMKNHDLGFRPEHVVAVSLRTPGQVNRFDRMQAYRNAVTNGMSAHGIASVGVSENVPGDYFNNTFRVVPVGGNDAQAIAMTVSSIDENFLDTYSASLAEGRNFSPDHGTDKYDAVIINQSAAKALGWRDAVGNQLWYIHEHHPLRVIGVLRDMNITSLQNSIDPIIYRYAADEYQSAFLSARLDPTRMADGLGFLGEQWNKIFPGSPFEYAFVKGQFDAKYAPEENVGRITEVFSVLAIVLAGLGLFGLVSLKILQRTKEIGVRKVLGATIPDILQLCTREFLLLVLIGNVVACPVSILLLNKWLQDYAYRTDIGVESLIVTAVVTVLIASLTVIVQALRAAKANPVESLRYE